MKSVHLLITDLFLPEDFAAEVCEGLQLPALEKILSRGVTIHNQDSSPLHPSLVHQSIESTLCGLFGVSCQTGAPVAPISAAFDGLGEGAWLRADPVHLRLQREQVVLLPNVIVSIEEALELCASLNAHFSGEGLEFFAPHPERWYVRLDVQPELETVPLSVAAGRNIHGNLPTGAAAQRWNQLFNEVQMLLHAHPLNVARESRGELAVNSLWFWGGGCDGPLHFDRPYVSTSSDDVLVEMLADTAGVLFYQWSPTWFNSFVPDNNQQTPFTEGKQLLVWTGLRKALQRGDLAAWRSALENFENGYAMPLWQALRSGKIDQLQLDVMGGDTLRKIGLSRAGAWAFWRCNKVLADYSSANA